MDIENRLVVSKAERIGGAMEYEIGVKRYKLEYTEWIDKFLLSRTGNYIQYPMINHDGKEYIWDIPGSSVVMNPHFHCRACMFNPWSGK